MVEALGKASETHEKLYYRSMPKNSEVYRSLDISRYRFLDSLAFLPHSLDELVKDFKARVHVNDMKLLEQSKLMKNENNRFDEDTRQKRDFCLKKVYSRMNISIVLRNCLKTSYLLKKNFIHL